MVYPLFIQKIINSTDKLEDLDEHIGQLQRSETIKILTDTLWGMRDCFTVDNKGNISTIDEPNIKISRLEEGDGYGVFIKGKKYSLSEPDPQLNTIIHKNSPKIFFTLLQKKGVDINGFIMGVEHACSAIQHLGIPFEKIFWCVSKGGDGLLKNPSDKLVCEIKSEYLSSSLYIVNINPLSEESTWANNESVLYYSLDDKLISKGGYYDSKTKSFTFDVLSLGGGGLATEDILTKWAKTFTELPHLENLIFDSPVEKVASLIQNIAIKYNPKKEIALEKYAIESFKYCLASSQRILVGAKKELETIEGEFLDILTESMNLAENLIIQAQKNLDTAKKQYEEKLVNEGNAILKKMISLV